MKIKHIFLTLLIGLSGAVSATDFEVTVTFGSADGSLAWAISQANNDPNTPHKITFEGIDNSRVTFFRVGNLRLTQSDVTIDGENTGVTINAFNNNIEITGNNVAFKNLTIDSDAQAEPGLLFEANTSGHLIENCIFDDPFWLGKVNEFHDPSDSKIINSTFRQDLSILGENNLVENCTVTRTLIIGNTGTWPQKAGRNVSVKNSNIGEDNSSTESKIIIVGFNNTIDSVTFFGKTAIILGENNTIKNSNITITNNPLQNDANPNTAAWFNSQAGIQIKINGNNLGNDTKPEIDIKNNVIKNNIIRNKLNISQTISIDGIRLLFGSQSDSIYNNDIEGFWNGILVRDKSSGTYVANNKTHNNKLHGIRTKDANNITITNNQSFGNVDNGIFIEDGSSNNTLTGNNVWNNVSGIHIERSMNNTIDSNFIGLDTLGVPNGNSQWGIRLSNNSSSNKIGENNGNIISANALGGINLNNSSFNEVYNNFIGRVSPINGVDLGANFENNGPAILIENGAASNIIGTPTKGNTIGEKENTSSVIIVNGTSTRQNKIQANSTFCNTGKGIELQNGGNNNFAKNDLFINRASNSTTQLFVKSPTTTSYFDLYIADTSCTPTCSSTGDGTVTQRVNSQGKVFLRRVNTSTLATPNSLGDYSIPLQAGESVDAIALTATDANDNTSEFAACRHEVLCSNPVVTSLTSTGDALNGFCDGGNIDISVSVNSADVSYVWELNGVTLNDKTSNTLNVNEAGTYSVTISDNIDPTACRTDTSISVIKYNNPTITGINGPDSTCFDIDDVLTYTTNSLGSNHSYTWSHEGSVTGTKNSGDTTYSASNFNVQPISKVTLTVENDTTQCSSTETFDVNVFDNPVIDTIQGEKTIQCGADGFTYTVSSNLDNANYVWTIEGPGSIVSANGADSTTVTVNFDDATSATGFVVTLSATAINPNTGCQSTSAYELPIRLIGCGLEADFNADTVICLTSSLINDTLTFSDASSTDAGVSIVKWEWDFGTDAIPEQVIDNNGDGAGKGLDQLVTYTSVGTKTIRLIVTDANGGVDTVTKTNFVTVNNIPDIRVIDGDSILCEGEEGNHFIVNAGIKENYTWSYTQDAVLSTDAKNDTATVKAGASNFQVNVNVIDSNQCSVNYDPFNVKVIQNIKNLTIIAPTIACTNPGKVGPYFFEANTVGGNTDVDYVWTTTPTIDVLERDHNAVVSGDSTNSMSIRYGTYTGVVTATVSASPKNSSCGEPKTATTTTTVHPSHPVYFSFTKPDVCEEDSVMHAVKVSWDGDNRPQPTQDPSEVTGSYHWLMNTTDTISRPIFPLLDGTGRWTNTLNDTVDSRPNDNDTITVFPINGDTLILTANVNFCYDFENSKLSDTLIYPLIGRPEANLRITSKDTEKSIEFLGLEGITNRHQFVDPLLKLPFVELRDKTTRFTNEGLIFTFENVVSEDSTNIINRQQTTSFIDVVPTAKNDQKYTLTYKLSVDNGTCIDSSFATLTIEFDRFIPNAFTPNGDDDFQYWKIENLEKYEKVSVQIFNRWGGLVFENDTYDNLWDGVNKNGEKLPFGTYFYIVDFNIEDVKPVSGSVSIIK